MAPTFLLALSNLVWRYVSVSLEAGILVRWEGMVVKYLKVERTEAHSTFTRI